MHTNIPLFFFFLGDCFASLLDCIINYVSLLVDCYTVYEYLLCLAANTWLVPFDMRTSFVWNLFVHSLVPSHRSHGVALSGIPFRLCPFSGLTSDSVNNETPATGCLSLTMALMQLTR